MPFISKKCRFGLGLFATKNFKKGELILMISGPIITQEEVDKKPEKEQANALQIKDDFYIDFKEPGVLVNHSCNPNAGIKEDKEMIAIKNIQAGQEITWDYSTSIDGGWTMSCACGEKECRKKVKDFTLLPKKTQKKYLQLGIVQKFIQKKYF